MVTTHSCTITIRKYTLLCGIRKKKVGHNIFLFKQCPFYDKGYNEQFFACTKCENTTNVQLEYVEIFLFYRVIGQKN